MRGLKEIVTEFKKVYIQSHDNPDADSIASGFGIYKLAKSWGMEAELFYCGRKIDKPDLTMMVGLFNIDLINKEVFELKEDELLICVDCQYGQGNVTRIEAENVIIIDHHEEAIEKIKTSTLDDIRSYLGACATLVFEYVKMYGINDLEVQMALYFGIYKDTGNLKNKFSTDDILAFKELKDLISENGELPQLIKNLIHSSLSLEDLSICTEALTNIKTYDNIIFTKVSDCDPNLLGYLADLLSEINKIDIVIIYSLKPDGYKISVRSLNEKYPATEIIKCATKNRGNGGGHKNMAGGFISKKSDESEIMFDDYLISSVTNFVQSIQGFDDLSIDEILGTFKFKEYKKKMNYFRYAPISRFSSKDIIVRTLEGDMLVSTNNLLFVGANRDLYPIRENIFEERYEKVENRETITASEIFKGSYLGKIVIDNKVVRINKEDLKSFEICKLKEDSASRLAYKLTNPIYISERREEKDGKRYYRKYWGQVGDYLVFNGVDGFYICNEEIFILTYKEVNSCG